jgi:acetolactate synthase-1/2/3 large subunit
MSPISEPILKTGAQHLVECLAANAVDRVFCVPGESYLAVLDALHDHRDRIQTVACRHENGASMMAEADGKLTGRPGICMVTRGPGAANASAGLHVAFQDSTPMILLIGQVGNDFVEREAFQEVDYRRMFGQMAKWVAQIDRADRVHEYIGRAFAVATSGRPGPVVLALPEDMLSATAALPPPAAVRTPEIHPSAAQMLEVREALHQAERPLLIVGGSRWDEAAIAAVEHFADRHGLPVIASFRRQDRFDNGHRCYVGDIGVGVNPGLKRRVETADLIVALGTRLGEMATSGYEMLAVPVPKQTLIHIHADAAELGRVYQPFLGINATPRGFAAMLDALPSGDGAAPREAWLAEARTEYEAWQRPPPAPGKVNVGEVVAWLRDNLDERAIVTNGAGNFAAWLHRFYRYRHLGTQLAPTSGSMGYGVPAAVAAKLRHPERTVVCVAGDGDFLMTGQELATAMQYGAAVIFVVVDNGMYGTIRMHQERHFPGRTIATDLSNPDFAALAEAYGAHGELVEETAGFPSAFGRATAAGRAALIHLKTDPEALTATQSLSQIREAALAKQRN